MNVTTLDQHSTKPSAEPRRYGNFQDPIGLVLRMLRSGNRAAYSAILREAVRRLLVPLDLLLVPLERRRLHAARPTDTPLILIVGPPRSGTTFVSQVLTAFLQVSYLSNLSALFPRSPITATRLFRRIAQRQKTEFTSFYGQTSGLAGAHDGFFVWNRWFGDDRYETVVGSEFRQHCDMQQFFDAWSGAFAAPFLNKNNRNTSCLDIVADALDNARFVVVRRDPASTVRSLIRAREVVQGDKHHKWGLASQESQGQLDTLGYVDDVCEQVLQIERELSDRLDSIDPGRVYEIRYEDFCERPRSILQELTEQFPELECTGDALQSCPESFRRSESVPLTAEEEARLHSCLNPCVDRNSLRTV